jgi:hypothetical protein
MGDVHQLDESTRQTEATEAPLAIVCSLESARCALCGRSLIGGAESYRLVSPLVAMGAVTVCGRCHKAALAEGYLPAR